LKSSETAWSKGITWAKLLQRYRHYSSKPKEVFSKGQKLNLHQAFLKEVFLMVLTITHNYKL